MVEGEAGRLRWPLEEAATRWRGRPDGRGGTGQGQPRHGFPT